MREYFIVMSGGVIVRRGVVPEGKAMSQPVSDGEEIHVVSREEYLASQQRTEP